MQDIRSGVAFIIWAAGVMALALWMGYAPAACAAGMVEADDDSYYNEVVRSKLPVILVFHAKWCGACRKVAPEVEKISGELSGRVKVVRMNVDVARTTASRYKVRSIPAFFYLEDGNVRGEALGAMSKEKLIEKLGVPDKPAD